MNRNKQEVLCITSIMLVTISKINVPGWNRRKTSWRSAYTATGHHLEYTLLFFSASLWHLYKMLLPEHLGKHWPLLASRQNGFRDQTSHLRKEQTASPHSIHWWLSHQRPVRAELHCQATCDSHPWRLHVYGLKLQLDNGGRSID